MAGRSWIGLGALLAGVGVAAGAVGTHFLKERLELPEADLASYETAVRYQMYHAFGLIVVGMLIAQAASQARPTRLLSVAGALFLTGIVLFSGGLYARIFTGTRPLVPVVPTGGMAWIVGWIVLAAGAFRSRSGPLA